MKENNKISASQPIGIFDSGIGGLTVAHAIKETLPGESIIYFGDTAHLPYGDKSEAAVQAYSVKIADVLLQKNCKVIVIACNSASSASYELLKEYVGSRAKVINVIDPMVEYVRSHFKGKNLGLIGTKRTVSSNIYGKKLQELCPEVQLHSLPTPLLVPMIEEGFINNKISSEIINAYLSDNQLQSIEGLILGCTHYPLIKEQIKSFYQEEFNIYDSSIVTAHFLRDFLIESNLLNDSENSSNDHFLVSDYTDSFEATARFFFQERISLENYPIWE